MNEIVLSDMHNSDRRLTFDLNILRNAPIMPPHYVQYILGESTNQ